MSFIYRPILILELRPVDVFQEVVGGSGRNVYGMLFVTKSICESSLNNIGENTFHAGNRTMFVLPRASTFITATRLSNL